MAQLHTQKPGKDASIFTRLSRSAPFETVRKWLRMSAKLKGEPNGLVLPISTHG